MVCLKPSDRPIAPTLPLGDHSGLSERFPVLYGPHPGDSLGVALGRTLDVAAEGCERLSLLVLEQQAQFLGDVIGVSPPATVVLTDVGRSHSGHSSTSQLTEVCPCLLPLVSSTGISNSSGIYAQFYAHFYGRKSSDT